MGSSISTRHQIGIHRSLPGRLLALLSRCSPVSRLVGKNPRVFYVTLVSSPSQQSAVAGTFGTTSWLSSRADPCRRANGRNLSTGTFYARNVIQCDRQEMLSPASESEDSRLLSAAMRALVILEARAAEVSVPPVSRRKAGVRDVRTLGYVHRMMHYIGTSKGAGVPRVRARRTWSV